jgi:Ca2+-transporting ATPase
VIQVIHDAVRGRARYKVRELYRCEPFKDFIEHRLSQKRSVKKVSASTLTANILVLFDLDVTADSLVPLIERVISEYRDQSANTVMDGAVSGFDLRVRDRSSAFDPTTYHRLDESFISQGLNALIPSRAKARKDRPWHLMDVDSVLAELGASRTEGLSSAQVRKNLRKYGPNLLPHSSSRSALGILIDQFKSFPAGLLGVAAAVSLLTGGIADAAVILSVMGINTAVGFATENEAQRTIEGLKTLVRPSVRVVRNGKTVNTALDTIVPGDLVVFTPGTYVPADCRLVAATHLSVDESALTGESMPVHKTTKPLALENVALGDRFNMVYMGTLVTGGQGTGVVVASGKTTEIGRLQMLLKEATSPETPMERELLQVGNRLALIGGGICGLIFLIGILRGQGFMQMFKTSISLAVAAVPEGLPMLATTTLALGIRRMNRRHVLIRNLNAVETLGAVQTICFDKTGTVTQNKMSVQAIYSGGQWIEVKNGQFSSNSEPINVSESPELVALIRTCLLCNETRVLMEDGVYTLKGSSTEAALVRLAIDVGMDVVKLRRESPVLKINHRSEDRHFMGTLHRMTSEGTLTAMKGSPLEVLAMCDRQMVDGQEVSLTDEDRSRIELENERMAARAMRVLGFAYYVDEQEQETAFIRSSKLVWLGLVGMADPVRPGIRELIALFHRAGIDTIMLTGDQSPTAYAIAKELDLGRGGPVEILDSMHLANIDPEALRALSERVHVFSRVSPAHKLQIVQALQKAGRVVAMTGDGINDSPALKAADIGIAMGHSGTDMAREVADVIAEEDELETIVMAVSQGRTIYGNIRKTLHFVLATNFSEIMVMFLAGSAGIGYPLSPMQLLWINLLSDTLPGIALALEPPEPDVLQRPPRNPEEPIIQVSDLRRIGFESAAISISALGAYGYGLLRYGAGAHASTMAFQSLTLAQLLHAISCRSEKHSMFEESDLPLNAFLRYALGGSLILQILTMLIPGLRRLLGISPISFLDGLMIGGSALLPLLVNESTKER